MRACSHTSAHVLFAYARARELTVGQHAFLAAVARRHMTHDSTCWLGSTQRSRRDREIGAVFDEESDERHVALTHSLMHGRIRVGFRADVGIGTVLQHHVGALHMPASSGVPAPRVLSRQLLPRQPQPQKRQAKNEGREGQGGDERQGGVAGQGRAVLPWHLHEGTYMRAVLPLAVVQSTSAPCSSSATTTSRWPSFCTAACSAVMPVQRGHRQLHQSYAIHESYSIRQ